MDAIPVLAGSAVALLLGAGTVLGNALVLYAFFIEKKLQKCNNYFLINLAVADMFVGGVSIPFYALFLIKGYWPLGDLTCDLWLTMDYTCCTSSCLSILVISVDRYWSLAYPVSYRVNMKVWVVLVLMVPTWVVPLGMYGFGILAVHQLGDREFPSEQCQVHYIDDPVYTIISTTVNYWAIIVVILVLYYKIYKITKFFWSKRRRGGLSMRGGGGHPTTSTATPVPMSHDCAMSHNCASHGASRPITNQEDEDEEDEDSSSEGAHVHDHNGMEQGKYLAVPCPPPPPPPPTEADHPSAPLRPLPPLAPRPPTSKPARVRDSKAMRVLTAVLGSFVACWTPYSVLVIVHSFNTRWLPEWLFYACYGLCYINSALNPILYAYANDIFRRTFIRILTCSN